MTTLVLANAVRYELQHEYLGRDLENVIDMYVNEGTLSRDAAIIVAGGKIVESWVSNILPFLSNNFATVNLHWTDLASASGSTGDITTGGIFTLPVSGTVAGDAMPSNVAVRVNKSVLGVRGSRAGRLYMSGVPESKQANGVISGPFQADLQAGWDQFQIDVTQDGADYASTPAVIHQPQIGAPTLSFVTAWNVLSALRSQGRRLRF